MRSRAVAIFAWMMLALAPAASQAQGEQWVEGKHYFLVLPTQRTNVAAGKVEVAEAFSYGCPACNRFEPMLMQYKSKLPARAQLVFVPASFNSAESWPLFQRGYLTAQALGIAERTHEPMYDAIWKTGELAVSDASGRLKSPQPTLEQVADFYARNGGITRDQFLAAAKSFGTETGIKRADAWMKACHVDQTPTFVVNGKYRINIGSAGGVPQLFELIGWLVNKEAP